jgi:hypothetical protein
VTSLTWLLLEPRSPHSRKPALSMIPELRLRQTPELRRFLILRTSLVPTYPKTNSKSTNRSLIRLSFSRIIRRSARCMWFIRISSRMHSEGDSRIYLRIRQIRRFEGIRFLPNSPTLAPRGSGLTPTIRFHENSWILVKKTSPSERRSGHVSSGKFATFRETIPLTPINRELTP